MSRREDEEPARSTAPASSEPASSSKVDAQVLETIERAFVRHAGEAHTIDAAKLKDALGLRSEYLAQRVLHNFDRNGDGVIDRAEFLHGVRQLVLGSDHDKLMFAFRLHDEDEDGYIGRLELLRMIAIGLAEDDVQTRASQPPERLTQVLLETADANRDGRISFAELEAVVRRYPRLLAHMTRSEALWIAPDDDLLAQAEPQPVGRLTELGQWLDNRRLELAYLGVFSAANAIVFGATLLAGHDGHPVSQVMQVGRACGACLSLDGALILLPVMRRTLTWLRSTRFGRVVPVDYAQDFHRLLGHALFGLALAHAVAFCASYASGHAGAPMSQLLLHTRRGSTGALLLLVLLTIWAFALALVRRSSRFETFYFSHRLYWVWFALAAVHAPEFLPWVGLPFGAWCVEQVSRLRRRGRDTQISATHALRSGVSRLEIARPAGFTHRPGDYVFVCVPAIAKHEWHPFTLSNAPENPTLCIHVRSLGNWSAALREWVEHGRAAEATDPVAIQIDGPYGSPSTHIFESRHAVLIGAGIGVTPFASVLESIVLRASLLDQRPTELRKVHFFWLNRDQYSFEWFAALLAELETIDHRDLLDVHICMTGGRGGATAAGLEVAREILHEAGQRDLVTGLRAMTHMGHPDWKSTLASIAQRHAPDPVDVYFCGPKGLGRKLRRICVELGMGYREEKF